MSDLPAATSEWEKGTLKCYNAQKDFGFLSFEDGDALILGVVLRRFGFRRAKNGDTLEFRYGIGKNGLIAVHLRSLLNSAQLKSEKR